MSSNALDPAALVTSLQPLLPQAAKVLNNPHDAIAALVHAAMVTLSFRLVAVDEAASSTTYENNLLPVEWNKSGPDHYTFKYRHEQSSLEFVIKVAKLGRRTLINAIALETDKVATLDIATDDFTSPSFYPHDLSSADAQPLIHGFISSNRVTDLMSQFKLKIFQTILPGLRKDGYTEENNETTASGARPPNQAGPSAIPQPRAPFQAPPRNPYQPQSIFPSNNPLEIGRRDLDPFASNPFSPPNLFPGSNSGDGMFVGPDHPIFGGAPHAGVNPRGPWGGDGFLPPLGAPPGARFDPIGPDPYPRRGGMPGFPGRGRGGPFAPYGPASGEPDNDEFMPPGAGDMYM